MCVQEILFGTLTQYLKDLMGACLTCPFWHNKLILNLLHYYVEPLYHFNHQCYVIDISLPIISKENIIHLLFRKCTFNNHYYLGVGYIPRSHYWPIIVIVEHDTGSRINQMSHIMTEMNFVHHMIIINALWCPLCNLCYCETLFIFLQINYTL